MTTLQIIFFSLFVVGAIITNVLWYHAKSLLRERGLPTSLFVRHFRDLRLAIRGVRLSGCFGRRILQWLFISIACFAAFFIVLAQSREPHDDLPRLSGLTIGLHWTAR